MGRAKRPDRRHFLAAARHPAGRDGIIALTLFLLPWVALLLVLRHHLDSGTMVAALSAVAAASIGVSTLWLTWAALREARRSDGGAGGLNLGQVADQLAVAVGTQWADEVRVRRLNDPYPLPVSWTAADASLTDTWESLVRLATTGAGWSRSPHGEAWAAGPNGLGGEGGELVDVLSRVPTGRLVVLGEPGAGKTMLMVRLVLDLLAHRVNGGPVPILAPVASWNPASQDLRGWLGARLLIDHPALANPPPGDTTQPTQAEALLASGLILPILDGLDEIPDEVRGPAISRINDALRPGEQVVVTCRTRQYRDAVRPQGGAEVTLRAAATIELLPLDAETVRGYLCDDAAGPIARDRWAPALAVLGTETPAGRALATPLMVGLARVVYNPRPGEVAGALRDPAELCSPALANRTAVESLLFDAFIPAAYRHDTDRRWKAQAEGWLVFLARHLEYAVGSPELAWWQLPLAVHGFTLVFGVALGVVAGIGAGVLVGVTFGVLAGVLAGIALGVALGVVAGIAFRVRPSPKPARGIRWQRPGLGNLVSSVLAGVLIGVVTGYALGVWAGVLLGILAGATTGAEESTAKGLAPLDINSAMSPPAVLARDRRTGTVYGTIGAAAAGVLAWFAAWLTLGGTAGVVAAVVAGGTFAVLGSLEAAWPSYGIARVWLALRRQLPWQFMTFLADAHRRGVLRQAGAVYQFRHIELQHRLARRGASEQEVHSPATPPAADA